MFAIRSLLFLGSLIASSGLAKDGDGLHEESRARAFGRKAQPAQPGLPDNSFNSYTSKPQYIYYPGQIPGSGYYGVLSPSSNYFPPSYPYQAPSYQYQAPSGYQGYYPTYPADPESAQPLTSPPGPESAILDPRRSLDEEPDNGDDLD